MDSSMLRRIDKAETQLFNKLFKGLIVLSTYGRAKYNVMDLQNKVFPSGSNKGFESHKKAQRSRVQDNFKSKRAWDFDYRVAWISDSDG